MQKAEQALKEDDPGVARHRFIRVVETFLDQPHGEEINIERKYNNIVLGFRGQFSSFYLSVQPFGQGFFKQRPAGEADFYLHLESRVDIKMRAEWCASITDPLGKPLQTSVVLSTVFEKRNGKYINEGGIVEMKDGSAAVRMLEDADFALHKDIKGNGWLFDGALHVAFDVRFRVLEGGYIDTSSSVDHLLTTLRNQIDNPICPDFSLISADGEEIKLHKMILTMQSPVFQAMFENDSEEARIGICKIENFNATSIKAMLSFLLGKEPEKWSYEMARDLYKLAQKYQLTALRNRSAMELSKVITRANFAEVLLLAYKHSENALLNEALIFVEDNFKTATLDGVRVGLASTEVPAALVRDRQEGTEIENSKVADDEDIADPHKNKDTIGTKLKSAR